MQKQGYDCECLGGGRISHQSQDKKIHVYGYSMVSPLALPAAWPARTSTLCSVSCRAPFQGLDRPFPRVTCSRKHLAGCPPATVG